ALFNPDGWNSATPIPASAWWLTGLLIFSGFAALIALMRTGINTFWATMSDTPAPVRVVEIAPVILLLALTVAMTIMAGPLMVYMQAMAEALYAPGATIAAVLNTPLVGAP